MGERGAIRAGMGGIAYRVRARLQTLTAGHDGGERVVDRVPWTTTWAAMGHRLPDRGWAVARRVGGERGAKPSTRTLAGPCALGSHPPEHFRAGTPPTSRAINSMTTRQGLHAVLLCVSVHGEARHRCTVDTANAAVPKPFLSRCTSPETTPPWDARAPQSQKAVSQFRIPQKSSASRISVLRFPARCGISKPSRYQPRRAAPEHDRMPRRTGPTNHWIRIADFGADARL
jgi:hypothetical protein